MKNWKCWFRHVWVNSMPRHLMGYGGWQETCVRCGKRRGGFSDRV